MSEPTITVTLTVRQAVSLCHACLLLRDTLADAHLEKDLSTSALGMAHLKLLQALERQEVEQ